MEYKFLFSLFLLLSIGLIDISGQTTVVKTPQPATIMRGANVGSSPKINSPSSNIPAFPATNNRYQQQFNMYERDRLEVERMNIQQRQSHFDEDLTRYSSIQYDLPSRSAMHGTEYYHRAMEKLLGMLSGKNPLSLKDAVFTGVSPTFPTKHPLRV